MFVAGITAASLSVRPPELSADALKTDQFRSRIIDMRISAGIGSTVLVLLDMSILTKRLTR